MYGRTLSSISSAALKSSRRVLFGSRPQILERELDDVLGGIEKRHAAVGEFRDDFRLEQHVEAVDRRIRHARLDHVDVVGEAVDGMQIGHGVGVVRVVSRLDRQNSRVEILQLGSFDLSSVS
jgi:hypothetical protein